MKSNKLTLTRERALEEHRKMWTWIAEKTLERKELVDKDDYFKEVYENCFRIRSQCWCCEYSNGCKTSTFDNFCKYCPIRWTDDGGGCLSTGSPFVDWTFDHVDYKKAAKLALMIANLPERSVV